MKKFAALLLALSVAAAPVNATQVQQGGDFAVAGVCDTENIEVGDQFLVRVVIDGEDFKYLTYSVCGSFDAELAELIAPVYKDDDFSIIWNKFDNETGEFQFDAADISHIEGSSDPLILSLLFKAKKAGNFTLTLGGEEHKFILGKSKVTDDNKYDYDFEIRPFEAVISDDTDKNDVVIIAEKEKKTPYDDMGGYEWAEISVGALAKLGILDGLCEESFEPGKDITRGEFAALLVRSAKLTGTTENFADVPEDYKFAAELSAARKTGIALGDGEGNFNPDAPVTREEVSAFVFRALSYKQKMKPVETDKIGGYLDIYSDKDDISEYAIPTLAATVRANIFKGNDKGKLMPKANMTRAEAATILERIIIHIKLVR